MFVRNTSGEGMSNNSSGRGMVGNTNNSNDNSGGGRGIFGNINNCNKNMGGIMYGNPKYWNEPKLCEELKIRRLSELIKILRENEAPPVETPRDIAMSPYRGLRAGPVKPRKNIKVLKETQRS